MFLFKQSFRIAPATFALDDKQAKKLWEVTHNTLKCGCMVAYYYW